MSSSRTFLAVFWIVYGVARLIAALWLLTFSPIAAVMFGALLTRVANPYSLMAAFHLIYLFWIILSAAAGIFALLAGAALLSGWSSARSLALVASVLSLSEVPVGLTLGTYTLVAFLPLTQDPPARSRA
jgi:uncharacterized membrane protein